MQYINTVYTVFLVQYSPSSTSVHRLFAGKQMTNSLLCFPKASRTVDDEIMIKKITVCGNGVYEAGVSDVIKRAWMKAARGWYGRGRRLDESAGWVCCPCFIGREEFAAREVRVRVWVHIPEGQLRSGWWGAWRPALMGGRAFATALGGEGEQDCLTDAEIKA